MNEPLTIEDIFDAAEAQGLYLKLLKQLNKDLLFANVDLEFDENTLPSSLKLVLQDEVYKLIQEKFSEYLNLLYIIDVSEKAVRELDGSDTVHLSEQITFLIMKREWQKVWFRHRYS